MKKISEFEIKSLHGLVCALLGAVMIVVGCGQLKHVPIESKTEVNIKDSTVFHIKDSIRYTEATRYKDLAWLGDSLKIEGKRSRAWAYADTTKEVLIGGLEEDAVEEHNRVIYKDRYIYKDSIQVKEVPVPVEIEKEIKIYPKWMIYISILGVISTMVLAFQVYLKIKKRKV